MEQQSAPAAGTPAFCSPRRSGSVKAVDFPVHRARCRFCQLLPLAYLQHSAEMYWHGLLNYDISRTAARKSFLRKRGYSEDSAHRGIKHMAKFAILCDYDNEWDGMEDKWHGP